MGLTQQKSGVRTLATGAVTDTYTFSNVFGNIDKVVVMFSGASSNFKIYGLAGDGTTAADYFLGTAGATITQTAGTVTYYPRPLAQDKAAADITGMLVQYVQIGGVKIDVTNVAQTETWSVDIYYDDQM